MLDAVSRAERSSPRLAGSQLRAVARVVSWQIQRKRRARVGRYGACFEAGDARKARDVGAPFPRRLRHSVAFDGSDTWSRGSADTPDLVWHENVASSEQGELFRFAVERAIDRAPTVAATSGFLDALLERTSRLHEAGSPRVVLATTTDDSAAERAGYHSGREWTVVLPQGPTNRCAVAPRVAPRLAAWVERQGIDTSIHASCEDLRLAPAWADGWWRVCRSAADTPPARCAVRVLIPEGSRCEPERGWRPSAAGITSTDGAGLAACDVEALELAEGACDEAAPVAETTPGWCLPEVTERCRRPGPTVVGRARKPGVLYELTCDTPPR